jgi:hypothetical protein
VQAIRLALLALTLFPAWAAAPAAPKTVAGDAAIEQAIRARFARSKISTNNFQVRVAGGVATLTGHTEVIQHKGVATRLAKLGGARRVENQIVISEAARKRAAANLQKSRGTAAAKRATVIKGS